MKKKRRDPFSPIICATSFWTYSKGQRIIYLFSSRHYANTNTHTHTHRQAHYESNQKLIDLTAIQLMDEHDIFDKYCFYAIFTKLKLFSHLAVVIIIPVHRKHHVRLFILSTGYPNGFDLDYSFARMILKMGT